MASALVLVHEDGTLMKVVGVSGGGSQGRTLEEWFDKGWVATSVTVHPEVARKGSPAHATTVVFVALERA
jgi:hypothetical protein